MRVFLYPRVRRTYIKSRQKVKTQTLKA
jgi:hypothetical protein